MRKALSVGRNKMHTLKIISILILLVFLGWKSTAQSKKNYHFDIDGGLGTSIGPTTFKTYKSLINRLAVQQYNVKRYRIPTIIIRGRVSRQLRKSFDLGISSGLNVHNLEINSYGNYYNAITVPVKLVGNISLLNIDGKKEIESEVKSGFNFQHQRYPPITEKGGFISSFALVLKSLRGKSEAMLIKLGYELQLDRSVLKFTSDNFMDKTELIYSTIKRHSIYMTAGIRL